MFRGAHVLCIVCYLILLDMTLFLEAYKNPSSDFNIYAIVKPKMHHCRTKREITSTKHSAGHYPEVTLKVSIDGVEHELDLRLNEELVPSGHTLSYQQGGQATAHTPGKEELEICQYRGRVRGKPGSWAAVSTCRGVRGVIYDGQHMRFIEPAEGNNTNVDHYLYSHEHLSEKNRRCGYVDDQYSHLNVNSSFEPRLQHSSEQRKSSRASRYKRNVEGAPVREPSNANSRTRYVELALVFDNSEFLNKGRDYSKVHHYAKDLVNILNSVYAPLNIFIALVGVEVWSDYDKFPVVETASENLQNFKKYRETELLARIPNDNAHFLTRKNFKDGIVGQATIGSMCSGKQSAAIASEHSEVLGLVAMTIAHEMGHNFGMDHDSDERECHCPGRKCVMSPHSTREIPLHWSSCSLRYLSLSFEKGLDYCLRNKPGKLFRSPTCGNGFLEEGEQCDCGTAPGEVSPRNNDHSACSRCCKPDCTLRTNATCGHGHCCDLTTCSYQQVATECRPAQRECDLPEFCTGDSQFCPQDLHKMDTTPCGNNQAYCAGGWCRTHTDQCRLLWGVSGYSADDVCYRQNTNGNFYGNCGYDSHGSPRRCHPEDVKCGLLQCRHYNNKLEYGLYTAMTGETYPEYNGIFINPCRIVKTELSAEDDPGLVPDGAKCGVDKMCMGHKCVSIELLRARMKRKGATCPSNCSGHGVCNSNGNCHCSAGFAPPLCDAPGAGGSLDSAPAADTRGLKVFMIVMYVVFLGIIPAIALALVLVIFFFPSLLCWKKPDARNPYQGTAKFNEFWSKFTLPKFNCVTQTCKNICTKSGNNKIDRKEPTKVIKYTWFTKSKNICPKNIEIDKKIDVKQLKAPRHKINKEDIVMVETCNNVTPVHNIGNPNVHVTKKSIELPNTQQSATQTVHLEANSPKIVAKKGFESIIDHKSTSNSTIASKPNINITRTPVNPNVIYNTNVSSKLVNFKPKDKLKPVVHYENKLKSETNELANQRSKLRKVSNIDVTK